MRAKRIASHWVKSCAFTLNGMLTSTHLNVLPLISYSILLSMDWLLIHGSKADCHDKPIEFLDYAGENKIKLTIRTSLLSSWMRLEKIKYCREREAYISEIGYNYARKTQQQERMFIVFNAYF